jgi:hypothetical protein
MMAATTPVPAAAAAALTALNKAVDFVDRVMASPLTGSSGG